METDIKKKFDTFHRKEMIARRISVLLAVIPFIIGSVWMIYSYKRVQEFNKQYLIIQEKSKNEELKYSELHKKKEELELELMKTYGLPIDSVANLSTRQIIVMNSINANNIINKLAKNYSPDNNITIRYYYKTIDDEKIVLSLKSLGYSFEKKEPSQFMSNQKTNCIWFGSKVSITDCKIVALALMRAGIKIKAIRGFRNNGVNPSFKSNVIEIGGDKLLEYKNVPSLTVEQVQNAKVFLRDPD